MKKNFWLDRLMDDRIEILKNKKLRYFLRLFDSLIIFCIIPFFSLNDFLNESKFWYCSLFSFGWLLFFTLISLVWLKIKKRKWKKDFYLSIAFYIIQPLELIGTIIIFILFNGNNTVIILLIFSLLIFIWNMLIFRGIYISNKPLANAILRWKNVYPIIKKSLDEYNFLENKDAKSNEF